MCGNEKEKYRKIVLPFCVYYVPIYEQHVEKQNKKKLQHIEHSLCTFTLFFQRNII